MEADAENNIAYYAEEAGYGGVSFAGLRIHSSLGGTVSFLGYENTDSTGLTVTDQSAAGFMLFGMATEIVFNETFSVLIGIYSEDKGGTLRGDWGILPDCHWELRYRYLQVPVHAKVFIPLLIQMLLDLLA